MENISIKMVFNDDEGELNGIVKTENLEIPYIGKWDVEAKSEFDKVNSVYISISHVDGIDDEDREFLNKLLRKYAMDELAKKEIEDVTFID